MQGQSTMAHESGVTSGVCVQDALYQGYDRINGAPALLPNPDRPSVGSLRLDICASCLPWGPGLCVHEGCLLLRAQAPYGAAGCVPRIQGAGSKSPVSSPGHSHRPSDPHFSAPQPDFSDVCARGVSDFLSYIRRPANGLLPHRRTTSQTRPSQLGDSRRIAVDAIVPFIFESCGGVPCEGGCPSRFSCSVF
jgi:hypothetical protein